MARRVGVSGPFPFLPPDSAPDSVIRSVDGLVPAVGIWAGDLFTRGSSLRNKVRFDSGMWEGAWM